MTTGCRKLRRVAAAAAVAVAAALRQGKGGESGWERWSGDALLADVGGQPGAELGAEIVAGEGQLDGGAEVVELVADVVAALDERVPVDVLGLEQRSEEHTSELQSLMRISYAVFCLKKKITKNKH